MAPKGSTQPSGALKDAIDAYGGLDKLKDDFNTKGAGQFGSGWAWVIKDSSGALKVTSTPNQDNPLMDDAKDVRDKISMAFRPGEVDLSVDQVQASRNAITIQDGGDLAMANFNMALDWSVTRRLRKLALPHVC